MEEPQATPKLLATKTAEAIQQYALKNYAAAADLYSRASVVQAELNGEMAPENAELLYAYGRCLYHVAIGKSDVLGEKVVGTGSGGDKPRGKKRKGAGGKAEFKSAEVVSQEHMDSTAGERSSDAKKSATTPYFQIEGDDVGWDSDESDGEDVDSEGEGPQGNDDAAEEEEVDDDFAIAYEILDTARILFLRRIEELSSSDLSNTSNRRSSTTPSKGKAKADDTHTTIEALNPAMRHFQELLADTYDLQSEISLENERFADATVDSKASLALKQQLYPTDSSMIAEAHFKVSLALEFGAKTTTEKIDELDGGGREEVEGVDEEMRKESARHMALAIESTKLRVEREQKEFEACNNKEDKEKRRKGIVDVKEMIADMEQRLHDLRAPTISLSTAALSDPSNPSAIDTAPLRGLLGSLLGETPDAQRTRIEEATKGANDLTGMIRKKKAKVTEEGKAVVNGSGQATGKRKAVAEERSIREDGKRARVEDVEEQDELA